MSARVPRAGLAALLVGTLVAVELALPALAHAQVAEGVGAAVPSYGVLDWLSLGVRLALVVAAIWLAVAGMRWYVRRVNSTGGRLGRQVQMLESRTLGPNRSLHLVRLGGRAVLLGVTAERINPLLTIEDAEEVERLADAATAPAGGSLQQLAGGLTGLVARLAPYRRPDGTQPAAHWSLARALRSLPFARARRPRPRYRSAAPPSLPALAASQRTRAAAAYGREATLAAAQRAIAQAQGRAGN